MQDASTVVYLRKARVLNDRKRFNISQVQAGVSRVIWAGPPPSAIDYIDSSKFCCDRRPDPNPCCL